MKNKLIILLLTVICFGNLNIKADEGMWILGNLNKQTVQQMKQLGLELSADQLYSTKGSSLKDAVISFGGFCTGVVVSPDGLVFTNHHCGFKSIQSHSTVKQDYIKNGFFAASYNEELPNPDLYVSFLLRTENVTKRVLKAVNDKMDELTRRNAIDSICSLIEEKTTKKDSTLTAIVSSYSSGNEYFLSVYRDYKDVRLVFAPPSSIGKFGGETDNWVWPRHNGDFSVFRIYADKKNRPASYSKDNVPFKPERYAHISLDGYKKGTFCMTIGYPGETERYLSSYGIEEKMNTGNAAMIQVRGIKQRIWKEAMIANDSIRIKYAAKYDESANYYKNSQGMNESVLKLNILAKKKEQENRILAWSRTDLKNRSKYLHLFSDLEVAYRNRFPEQRAFSFLAESFANSSDLLKLSLVILNTDFSKENTMLDKTIKDIADTYANTDFTLDKKVFCAMLNNYHKEVPDSTLQPEFYRTIANKFHGDTKAFADSIYSHTQITSPKGLLELLRNDSTQVMFKDPAISMAIDIMTKFYELQTAKVNESQAIDRNERMLTQAIKEMEQGQAFYSDANSTQRLSFGTVQDYEPKDGIRYNYYTTTRGVFEKTKQNADNRDFDVIPKVSEILQNRNFGPYGDENGEMRTCFITNNDITGGNSGSPMFDGKGNLIGLAFDGNWEAMSSDLTFEPQLQRCIGVDIRYVIYVIEKLSGSSRLTHEIF